MTQPWAAKNRGFEQFVGVTDSEQDPNFNMGDEVKSCQLDNFFLLGPIQPLKNGLVGVCSFHRLCGLLWWPFSRFNSV